MSAEKEIGRLFKIFKMKNNLAAQKVFGAALLLGLILQIISFPLYALGTDLNPTSADQVITTIKNERISPELSQLQQQIKFNPENENIAGQLINEYLKISKQTGDERYLGHAMAIINHWPMQSTPERILLLKARVIQRQHHFAEALALVNRVLEINPNSGEAYLLAAYIYMAQGELELARRHCAQATRWLGSKEGLNCTSRVQGLSGQAEQAYQILRVILNEAADIPSPEQTESYLTLAEIATRLGRESEAEKYYGFVIAAANSGLSDIEPQAIYGLADLLLAQKKYQECINLLKTLSSSSAGQLQLPLINIQLILAKTALGENVKADREQLQNYFELEQLRNEGDSGRGYSSRDYSSRDYARYLLEIENDVERALSIALSNWQTQKEPDDLLVLVKSAEAANEHSAIADALKWRQATGLEDRRLDAVISNISLLKVTD